MTESLMPIYLIESHIGVFALKVETKRKARAYTRRRYGSFAEPIQIKEANIGALQDHLHAGCVIFDGNGEILDPREAYERAALPLPKKFGGPDYHTGHARLRSAGLRPRQEA